MKEAQTDSVQGRAGLSGKTVDFLILLLLICGAALWMWKTRDFSKAPAEDAAMLLRYAQNLSEDHGIVFNPGEKPVDGATDFLSMVLVSQLYSTGLSIENSGRWLCLLMHFFTVILLYYTILNICRCPRWMAVLSAAFLAVGPGTFYAEIIFCAPVFAFFCLLAWAFALNLVLHGITVPGSFAFGLASLLAGLTRPEGVIFFLLCFLSIWFLAEKQQRRLLVKPLIYSFVIPGLIYFTWHWIYFGHPLPNPFYVKGRGSLHLDSFFSGLAALRLFLLPFLPLLAIGFIPASTRKNTFFLLLPPMGFLCAWILISNEMNYLMRFQYPMVPVILSIWPLIVSWTVGAIPALQKGKERPGNLGDLAAIALIAVAMFYQFRKTGQFPIQYADSRATIARELAEYKKYGYKMVVTEAGNLPLYSGWPALDAWGLNNSDIAHAGKIPEGMLALWSPEIIMFHDNHSPASKKRKDSGAWGKRCDQLKTYAEQNHYVLAATWGENEDDAHWYYVKPGFQHSDELVKLIRDREYFSFVTGNKCRNFIRQN